MNLPLSAHLRRRPAVRPRPCRARYRLRYGGGDLGRPRRLRARRSRRRFVVNEAWQASRDRPRSTTPRSLREPARVARHRHHRRAVPGRLERDLHRRDAGDRAAAGARRATAAALCFLQHQSGAMSRISRKPMPACSAISARSSCRPASGLRKPDAAAYDHVVKAIGVPASRIVFFDDSADNIAGARARGLERRARDIAG